MLLVIDSVDDNWYDVENWNNYIFILKVDVFLFYWFISIINDNKMKGKYF